MDCEDAAGAFVPVFQVRIASRAEVAATARVFLPTHLVSVVVKAPVVIESVPAEDRLHLRMDDILVTSRSMSPSTRHVRALFDFADNLPSESRVLFHCEAGISRSSAAAWICLVRRMGLEAAADTARYVRSVRSMADPNPLLIRLAARALHDSGGRMEAARKIFDGWKILFDEEDSFGILPEGTGVRAG